MSMDHPSLPLVREHLILRMKKPLAFGASNGKLGRGLRTLAALTVGHSKDWVGLDAAGCLSYNVASWRDDGVRYFSVMAILGI